MKGDTHNRYQSQGCFVVACVPCKFHSSVLALSWMKGLSAVTKRHSLSYLAHVHGRTLMHLLTFVSVEVCLTTMPTVVQESWSSRLV